MDAFFELKANGELVIKNSVIASIPVIKKIYRRDRGGLIKGDSEGRDKQVAKAEIMYAWWIVNATSPIRNKGLTETEIKDIGKKQVGLPDTWKPDDVVEEWIKIYSDYHKTNIAVETLNTTINSLTFINGVMTRISKQIKDKLATTMTDAEINVLMDHIKTITKLANDVPTLIETNKKALLNYYTVEQAKKLAKGDTVIVSSMDPDDDV